MIMSTPSSATFNTTNWSSWYSLRHLWWLFLSTMRDSWGGDWYSTTTARNVRIKLCDSTNSLCASFPKDHAWVIVKILWTLDETKETGSFVPGSQVVLVHCNDGSSLTSAATMDWGLKGEKRQNEGQIWRVVILPIAWYLGDMVVGWCNTNMSASNSQQETGSIPVPSITIPLRIWLRRV